MMVLLATEQLILCIYSIYFMTCYLGQLFGVSILSLKRSRMRLVAILLKS